MSATSILDVGDIAGTARGGTTELEETVSNK
jgi:hypothetical protein